MREVPGCGPKDAKVVIVGEAPGAEEEQEGEPFVGKTGVFLMKILSEVGLPRKDLYITNVVKYRPPDNKFDRLGEIGVDVHESVSALQEELSAMRPNVVLAVGRQALMALTGKGSITAWRGSILRSTLVPGLKIIPTIHPSYAFRKDIKALALIRADVAKLAREARFPDFRSIPTRQLIVSPTWDVICRAFDRLDYATHVSLDIESYKGTSIITEVGLGDSRTYAITIPIYKRAPVWSPEQEAYIWKRIRRICQNPRIGKIIQNVNFEREMLFKWVGEIYPVYMDTLIAGHLCYCELPKDLETLASLYANEPYWKGAKDHVEYNAKDVAVTYEVAENLEQELADYDLTDFMHGYQMPLSTILWRASHTGIRFDVEKQARYRKETEEELQERQSAFWKLIGWECNVASSNDTKKLLYEQMGLTRQRKAGRITTDKEAIAKLLLRAKTDEETKVLQAIRDIRILRKSLSSVYSEKMYDADHRVRTEWVITGTVTGRLSSRQNIRKTGCNMQNIPKHHRDMFLADPGHVFVIADMSQVEARFVAWLSGDTHYKKLFKSGEDIHKQVAAWIFHTTPDKIIKPQRQRAKATAHGTPYGMQYKRVADMYGISVEEAKWLQGEYYRLFPMVKTHYQDAIVDKLRHGRLLFNTFGRRRLFLSWWNDELKRAAWAHIPQGSAGDLINRAIVRSYPRFPEGTIPLIQVHDEWVIQCKEGDVDTVAAIFKEEVEMPIYVNGDWMSVPLEVEVGTDWKNKEPWEG